MKQEIAALKSKCCKCCRKCCLANDDVNDLQGTDVTSISSLRAAAESLMMGLEELTEGADESSEKSDDIGIRPFKSFMSDIAETKEPCEDLAKRVVMVDSRIDAVPWC